MKIKLSFCELHNPLFLGGTNLDLKLSVNHSKGVISLTYDREAKEVHVRYNNKLAIIPTSNVASMTPADPKVLDDEEETPELKPEPPIRHGKFKAQVSTPQQHVTEGLGSGRTND